MTIFGIFRFIYLNFLKSFKEDLTKFYFCVYDHDKD